MKGGAATTTASSDVDFDVTGRRGRDEREGGQSRMMHPGGGARAVALASDDVPRREEPRRTRTLPPWQNKISRQFRRRDN